MTWRSLEARKYTFEKEGDKLVGELTKIKNTQMGGKAYHLISADKEEFYFFGCTQLDRALEGCLDKIVSIIYRGRVNLKGGKTMKNFSVQIWESDEGTLPEGFEEDVPY